MVDSDSETLQRKHDEQETAAPRLTSSTQGGGGTDTLSPKPLNTNTKTNLDRRPDSLSTRASGGYPLPFKPQPKQPLTLLDSLARLFPWPSGRARPLSILPLTPTHTEDIEPHSHSRAAGLYTKTLSTTSHGNLTRFPHSNIPFPTLAP